jgi:CheY-like chemotaxis protein
VARVLVIDDDEAVTETFVRMLQSEGHEVTAVAEPLAGLSLVRKEPPDAILLDMRMPLVGGLEFLRTLRADPQFRRLPVGVVTGDYFVKDEALSELEALGAVIRYKPLWLDDLSALVQRLLAPAAAAAGPGTSAS